MAFFTEILPQLPMYVLIVLSASGVILGDYSAKSWSVDRDVWHLVFAFVGYFFSAFFYIPSLLKNGLVITGILWDLISVIGFLIIGLIIFKETITAWQTAGVSLGIIALIIISLGEFFK